MSSKILVAYATRYGSTREVAERIGAKLRGRGADVDISPAASVTDLSGYSAVVLGAPYYIGKMLKDATAFLEQHHSALETMLVAIFALGPVQATDDMDEAREQLDKTLEKMDWLKPVATEMFVGKYDPAVLRGLDKLVSKPKASPLHGLGAHDDCDWDAIDGWAESLSLGGADA
jgi:menaquinone-dependent protoporphyrinogen oxidase